MKTISDKADADENLTYGDLNIDGTLKGEEGTEGEESGEEAPEGGAEAEYQEAAE
jgi:hypothetical protein